MNYKRIYQDLVERGKAREAPLIYENHHVIPKCLGGTDSDENLVKLTPEEHYVAHQLLVKIYPDADGLVYAAQMMVPNRPNNKMYGWLKRRYREVCRKKVGKKNSQYGTKWISNITLKVNKKIKKTISIPDGWVAGRNKWNPVFKPKRTRKKLSPQELWESRSRASKGRKLSPSTKKKIGEARSLYFKDKTKNPAYGKSYRWINNGLNTKKLFTNQSIPDGWTFGRRAGD